MATFSWAYFFLLGVLCLSLNLPKAASIPDLQIWVSNSGNDSSGDGTLQHPYQTPTHAFQVHPDNVQLMLMEGTYNISIPPAATNIAVIGSPKANLNWFIWQQAGVTTPLTILLHNLNISHDNESVWPLLQLNGQLQNATIDNVHLTGNAFGDSQAIATFITGPLAASRIVLSHFYLNNIGTMAADVQFSGFSVYESNNLDIRGNIGTWSVDKVGHVNDIHSHYALTTRQGTKATFRFQGAQKVVVDKSFVFSANFDLLGNEFSSVSDSVLDFVSVRVGNIEGQACHPSVNPVQFSGNRIVTGAIHYEVSDETPSSCPQSRYVISFKANWIQQSFQAHSTSNLDFKGNYWDAATGPSICSNPGGDGASISYYIDFSAWCKSEKCNALNNDYPLLLQEVISGPCQRPTAGAIAVFITIFFVIVAINVVMLIVYCMYCNPRKTDTESIHTHYAGMTSTMTLVAGISLVILAFSGIIGSAACPTRVYATKCPFTLTDRAVAGNGLLFGGLMLLVSAGSWFLLKFNLQEQRPILYTAGGYQILSLAVALVVLILSLKNLSSSLRGPYMHLLAVPSAGYIVFCVLQLYHLEKLRHYCRHTHIALELSDYKHERAPLIQSENSGASLLPEEQDSASETGSDMPSSVQSIPPPIDEYTINTVMPIQIFYSDYQRITKRWLLAENALFFVLLAFAIWYTIGSYRIAGAILISLIVLEYFRILLAIYVTKSRGPILGFKVLMVYTGITKLALLALSIFLYVQVFSLTSHNSAYFTASLLAPTFFFGIVTTIRIWKMFEVVHAKHSL